MSQLTTYTVDAAIAINTALAAALDLGEGRAALLQMPAAWDAAAISFDVSADGATYGPLYKADGTEYSLAVAASRTVLLPLADFLGVRFVKLRSGLTGAPVNQTAARAFKLRVVG